MKPGRIAVTGSSGKLGRQVVIELVDQGYTVICVDRTPGAEQAQATRLVNLGDLGETIDVLQGCDAIVHLAAIPGAFIYANHVTWSNNVQATYNVYEAAACLGIKRIVLASSECAYGIGFARDLHAPDYLPLDEDHPLRPEDCYGLSKVVCEQIAESFWRRSQIATFALRFGFIHLPADIQRFPSFNQEPTERVRNLWNYIDVRDAARACRLSLEASLAGVCPLNIVADNTCMDVPNAQLIRACFPDLLDLRGIDPDGFSGLISNKKAKSMLGWQPEHDWRQTVGQKSEG